MFRALLSWRSSDNPNACVRGYWSDDNVVIDGFQSAEVGGIPNIISGQLNLPKNVSFYNPKRLWVSSNCPQCTALQQNLDSYSFILFCLGQPWNEVSFFQRYQFPLLYPSSSHRHLNYVRASQCMLSILVMRSGLICLTRSKWSCGFVKKYDN
jgi:hypothetical protein